MQLISKEIADLFEKYPLYSQDGKGMDAVVVLKLFTAAAQATWLITEGEWQGDDFLMYGYVTLGYEWEWGYVSLREIESLPDKFLVEKEIYQSGGKYTVRELVDE